MRRVWFPTLVAFGLGLVAGALAWSQVRDRPLNRYDLAHLDIDEVLAKQVDAWNRGDLDGFMAGYLNSPDLTFRSGGTVTNGYDGTLARYRNKYQAGGAEMGRLRFSELHVAPFGKIADVTGRWTLDRNADTPTGLFTLRMELTPDGWKIVDDHTSAVEPTPQKVKIPEKN